MWSPHFNSPGWPQLASAGLDWPRLASAGIGWPRLVSARLRLPQLAPAGFGWLHLWWCPGLWSRNQLAGWLVASSAVCPPAWCAGQLGGARLAGWLRLRFAGCPPGWSAAPRRQCPAREHGVVSAALRKGWVPRGPFLQAAAGRPAFWT